MIFVRLALDLSTITLRGVTGANKINVNEIHENLQTIKQSTDLPVLAGFGIKTKEDATEISKLAGRSYNWFSGCRND